MRHFTYYLFENFDADIQAENPHNPRRFLTESADPILSKIAEFLPHQCPASIFDPKEIAPLLHAKILRMEGDALLFNTPIFLKEDVSILRTAIAAQAQQLAEQLLPAVPQIYACCASIQNSFPVEENLYHILCGMVFDGLFFDYLSAHDAVATSRVHPGGLDYLSVIYENCPELDAFSNTLLCSYNRCTDGTISLQTFGDANGDRLDFYRASRLQESGHLPVHYQNIPHLPPKAHILKEVRLFLQTGHCDAAVMDLLERFGYAKNGTLCVPVLGPSALTAAETINEIVEDTIGSAFIRALSQIPDITALRHGVDPKEVANELYHILFGTLNDHLAALGIVANPPHIPGEGRYLRCIQLDV